MILLHCMRVKSLNGRGAIVYQFNILFNVPLNKSDRDGIIACNGSANFILKTNLKLLNNEVDFISLESNSFNVKGGKFFFIYIQLTSLVQLDVGTCFHEFKKTIVRSYVFAIESTQ